MSERFPKHYTLGVVYRANAVDLQGDTITAEELERAAWNALGKRISVGLMHRPGTAGAGRVVESYIWRGPKWAMKGVDGKTQAVDAGDWLLGVVWNPTTWEAIQNGQITGYSLQGFAAKSTGGEAAMKSRGSIFRSIVFGDDVSKRTPDDEDEPIDDRLRVDDDPDVVELNEAMSRSLARWAGQVEDDATRSAENRRTPNFRREGSGQSLPMRPMRTQPEYPEGGFRMMLEDEDSIDVEEEENFLRPADSGIARPARSNWPEPSNRVGGLIRKRGSGLFTDIIFGA